MLNGYNDYGLSNPNGRSGGIPQYLPSRFGNEKIGAVDQYPARYVRQQIYTAQRYEWRPQGDWEDEDGDSPERESASAGESAFEESFADGANISFTGSEAGTVSAQLTAASVSAVAVAAAVYIFFLLVAMTPCSATTDALAFTLSVQNPDNVPLVAVLTSETGATITRDATNATYLLFDGLEKGTKYELSILNSETGEVLARQSYVTAQEDAYGIAAENVQLSPDGVFSFDLSVEGLRRSDFYTVTVMGADGKPLYSVDGTDAEASFAVPIGTLPEGSPMPFVTVSVNGKTFMPRVWAEPEADGGAEPEPSEGVPTPPDDAAPIIGDASEETPPLPDAPEEAPTPPEDAPENPEPPTQPPETPETPPETPETPPENAEEAAQPPAEVPQETAQTPATPAQVPREPTPTPQAPAQVPQEAAQTPEPPEAPEEERAPEIPPEQEEAPDEEEIQAKWTWNEDHTAVTVEIPDPDNPGSFIETEAPVTESVREPTCTEDGARMFSASVEGPNGETYADTRTEPIPAKGHSYERVSLHTEGGSSSADYICSECGDVYRMSAAATEEPSAEEAEP